MNKQYNAIIHPAAYYQQALARRNSQQPVERVSEDKKVTRRLPLVGSAGGHLIESEDHHCKLFGSPLRLSDADANHSRKSDTQELVSEPGLTSLRVADQLIIETAHSVYSFTVSDPATPSGKLLGGVLGNRLVNAALIPSRSASGPSSLTHNDLGTGSKMIFIIEQGNNLRRLTTSTVTRLLHRKASAGRRVPARRQAVEREHVSSD